MANEYFNCEINAFMDKFFDGPEEEELDTPPKPSRPVDVKPYLIIV